MKSSASASAVRMRNACRVLGDAAVVRQHGDRFSVPKPRRTQNQPLGLEDGDTSLAKRLRWYFLQCHDTGLLFEMLKGETVSVSPLKSPWAPPVRNRHRQTHYGSTVLLCRGLRLRKDGDEHAAFGFGIELHATVDQSEQGVILAHADVQAGMPLGAALARENIAGDGTLWPPNILTPRRWPPSRGRSGKIRLLSCEP